MTSKKNRGCAEIEILIAEDSPTQAEQLRYLLEEHNYDVTVATNGRRALDAALARKPALIISDIMMPELDGYGLCKAVKADEMLKEIPVILVTTLSDPQDVIRGLECGADNFIRKPYNEHDLLSRIDYLLMNVDLRKNQKMQFGVEINLGGRKHFVTSERQQILDLLISTFEQAVHLNAELKQREIDLARTNEVLQGLYRVAEGLNQALGEREVAEMALDRAMELPGVHAGWIHLRTGESGFKTVASRNVPPALSGAEAFDGDCVCQRKLLSGELDSVTNIFECERLGRAKGDTQGLRYHASVPLWIDKRVLGVMNLVGPEQEVFDDEALKVLHSVGHQVAVALDRVRMHEHLENLVEERTAKVARLNRIYSVLSGINTTIVRIRDRQELFQESCRIAVDDGNFAFCWIGMLDEQAQKIVPVAVAGRDDGYLSLINLSADPQAPGSCILATHSLRHAEPAICNDIANDERMAAWREETARRGYGSVAAFPLILEDRPVGVFLLYAREAGVFDDEEMRLLVEMAGDISFALDHLKKEEKLDYLAYFDAVTELPNRTLFWDRVDQWIGAARHEHESFFVIMADIERFSAVNETLGRRAGDELLRQVAQRLREAFAETDVVARVAGDCFAIATRSGEEEADIAHILEQALLGMRARPFIIDGKELRIAMRAGVASYPGDGSDVESLYSNAEAALKKAKASQELYHFYTPEINAQVAEKLSIENKLRRALELNQLVLHYQPKVNLQSGRICGLEALIRWNDPDSGLTPPNVFIPVLEETGMILDAGRWALEQALADARKWEASGVHVPRISVNVSAIQLRQTDFVPTVQAVLDAAADVSAGLELEITETLIMQDIEANIAKLQVIREMGVQVAIDDFGTGYSSLSYIGKLPVNTLKIDRTFVMNMASRQEDLNIVSTIVSLAHSLGLNVIAEGVETQEQSGLLKGMKCDEIQGFVFSPAVDASRTESLLRNGTR